MSYEQKKSTLPRGNRFESHEDPSTGYDVLDFNGEGWEKLKTCSLPGEELCKLLIWLKRSDIAGNRIYVESTGVKGFVLAKEDWKRALNQALPAFTIEVNTHRKINRLTQTDLYRTDKEGNKFPLNGLSVKINGTPIKHRKD